MGIHLLLEEIDCPYKLAKVDFARRAQYGAEYVAINPKSKVPALQRQGGSVLTEFPAIAYWLAGRHPEARLFPGDIENQARALEILDYVVSTLHMQGFTRIWRPGNFTPSETDYDAVRVRGRTICDKGLSILERALEGKDYAVGEFSIADAALFYFEFWLAFRIKMPMPANCETHLRRILARPSARKVIDMQGLQEAVQQGIG